LVNLKINETAPNEDVLSESLERMRLIFERNHPKSHGDCIEQTSLHQLESFIWQGRHNLFELLHVFSRDCQRIRNPDLLLEVDLMQVEF